MGEVYRAHDPELHRDVALKILRRSLATPDEIVRFGREARAAGGLNHPNIVVVYDVGVEAGAPYVVTELLEGETLRARLDRGAIGFPKAVDYGSQIAEALGAAHARSIWHRDVKPANVFITHDGRVKLLDFGIAKLGEKHLRANANDPTEEVSDRHSVFGTAGYMSPEQVLGHPADHRTDIFAFGAVLYEMFTRTRAFRRDSTVQTMNAVLQDDPPDPLSIKPDLPPMAVAIVRRCLEKNKEERFQSARDLAFDLQQLRDASTRSRPLPVPPAVRRRKVLRWMAGTVVVAAAVAAGWLLAQSPEPPTFEQLTFSRARIGGARFVSNDRAVVYSEVRQGSALQLWRLDFGDSPPTRPLEYPVGTDILAAKSGELALSLRRRFLLGERFVGTLAIAPLGGGMPREEADNIEDADWDPQGDSLVVVRSTGDVAGRSWLEYPRGTVRYETTGSIRFPRVSGDGKHIAFLEDSGGRSAGGHVSVLDLADNAVTRLTDEWASLRGLAWSAGGGEIWFTAGHARSNRSLRAVDLRKNVRPVLDAPGSLTLWDIASDGRVMISRDDERRYLVGVPPGGKSEVELSWFDDSGLAVISNDGRQILFSDRFGVFLRQVTGTPPIDLGLKDAFADDLSADGRSVLATRLSNRELVIVPVGPGGQHQTLPAHGIVSYNGALWLPNGRQVVFNGKEQDRNMRAYIQEVAGDAPRPFTPENVRAVSVSPAGDWVATIGPNQGVSLYPVAGGAPRVVDNTFPEERPIAWGADGRSIWVFRRGDVPATVYRVNIDTGRRDLWKTLTPHDSAGVFSITELDITPDGLTYFYSYKRLLSQLYLVSGLE